jgi:hypothetical protein
MFSASVLAALLMGFSLAWVLGGLQFGSRALTLGLSEVLLLCRLKVTDFSRGISAPSLRLFALIPSEGRRSAFRVLALSLLSVI